MVVVVDVAICCRWFFSNPPFLGSFSLVLKVRKRCRMECVPSWRQIVYAQPNTG